MILAPLPTPAISASGGPADPPTPTASPSCLRASDLCKFVYEHTHNSWLASSSYYLLVKPLQIVLIIAIAIALRFVLHRSINQLVRRTANLPVDRRGALLRLHDAVFSERRRQRAEAIGSVLNSFATAAIFSIAGLMVLAQLGIELAPLLASAGIAGLALGFGAQTLVKDLIAGLFMLLEDQYGVGDQVDLGEASGKVESVGLRTTSIRDARGVLWHIRNGEIIRVGNKSQGWALVVIDVPIGFASVDEATHVMQEAVDAMAADEQWRDDLMEAPQILGVEHLTVDGATIRATVKTTTDAQPNVTRELRLRLTEALAIAGITGAISASRVYVRPPSEPPTSATAGGG
jgi:moderate conductance mechanosensitive channel